MTVTKHVDLAALDPENRRLADRGARELLGMALDELTRNRAMAWESLDAGNIEGLVLAGQAAEEIDRRKPGGPPDAESPGKPGAAN
jgi:hypothetical protein